MQTYKRSIWTMLKGIILAPFGGLAAYVVIRFFTDRPIIALGVPALAFFFLVYLALFSENIYFELDENGNFRYYQRGKLRNEFFLGNCQVGYRRKTESGLFGNQDINLWIEEDGQERINISCAPLGRSRFDQMFSFMEKVARNQPEVLVAEKGEQKKTNKTKES